MYGKGSTTTPTFVLSVMAMLVCSPTIRWVSIGRAISWSTSLPPRTLLWALGGLFLPPSLASPLLFSSFSFWRFYLLWWTFQLLIDWWRGRWWCGTTVNLSKVPNSTHCWPLTPTVFTTMATFKMSKPTRSSSSAWSLLSSSFFGSPSEADSSPEYDLRASIVTALLLHTHALEPLRFLHVITRAQQVLVGGPCTTLLGSRIGSAMYLLRTRFSIHVN